jgi:multimeric flavodoxin WrbA
MKLLVVLGSRNPEGQTAQAATALLEGVTSAGGRGERVYLPQGKFERCRQCDDRGWGTCRSEGKCVIEDDLTALIAKIEQADAAVFATPVYFSDLSESMRALLDRLRRITRHPAGRAKVEGKTALGICVAGGGGGGAPECAVSLKGVLRTCGFDVVDMIPARRQNLDMKCEVLRITGRWLAGGQRDQAGVEQEDG